jgi:hypothetical protein
MKTRLVRGKAKVKSQVGLFNLIGEAFVKLLSEGGQVITSFQRRERMT